MLYAKLFPTSLRALGAVFALMLALFALEVPAAAHFGATHVAVAPVTVVAADHRAAAESVLAQAPDDCSDDCGDNCSCCTTCVAHGHCHAPAVLGSKAHPQHHIASASARWAMTSIAAPAISESIPPVPPPNAA